jgi:hypothetical protein
VRSLGGIGVESRPLGGRSFHLPIPGKDEFDTEYEAVLIPASEHNLYVFEHGIEGNERSMYVGEMNVPLLRFNDEGKIEQLSVDPS